MLYSRLKTVLRSEGALLPVLLLVSLLGILVGAGYMAKAQRHAAYVTHVNNVEGKLALTMRRSVLRRAIIARDLALLTDQEAMKGEMAEYIREEAAYRNSQQELTRMFTVTETTDREKQLLAKIDEAEMITDPVLRKAIELGLANRDADAAKMIFAELLPRQKQWAELLAQLADFEESLNQHLGDEAF